MRTFARIIALFSCAFLGSADGSSCASKPPDFPDAKLMTYTADTALYMCADGYERPAGSRVSTCTGGVWSKPSLRCEKKSCGNAGELLNGYIKYDGDAVLGAKAFPICNDGFTLKGPESIECGIAGWPTDHGLLLTCEEVAVAVTCPAPEVANSVKKGVARDNKVGAMVTVSCRAGFQARGQMTVTCGADGLWKPPLPQCVPRAATTGGRCSAPENSQGSNVQLDQKFSSIKSFPAGAKVYYVCVVGHVHNRGSKYRICTRGQWSPLELQCRRRLCGSAGELQNGHYTYTGAEFGDSATAECDPGFQLVGKATRYCLSLGWDGHDPLCEELSCDDPPEVSNAEVVGFAEARYSPRTVVTYRCQVGVLMGHSEIWCTDNGTWSSPLPQCKDVTCASPNIPNASWVRSQSGRYLYKDSISIQCAPHFSLSGPRTVTCDQRGQWSPELPKCREKSCGNAGELLNGYIKYDGDAVLGAKAFPICNDGFTLKGPESIECGIAGWPTDHGLLLTCEEVAVAVTCPAPEVANSVKKVVARDYKVGVMVIVSCRAGFQARGQMTVTCGADGLWKPPLPQCVPRAATTEVAVAVTCPAPEVANSVKKGVARDNKVGAMVTVSCRAGFQARGQMTVTCGADGLWKPPLPQCVPRAATTGGRCSAPENSQGSNVQLDQKFSSIKSFPAGAKVYYVCVVGHVHNRGSKYRICTRGQWSPLELQCRRRLCGSAGELQNGHYTYTGAEFGDSATAECDPGFQLVGKATRYCLSLGWDGHDPLCEELSCDDPPEVSNAEVVGFAEARYSPRTVVTYRCQVGVLMGHSEIWCTDNGTWSSPLPQCKDVTCASPNIPNASWVRSQSGRYLYKDSISIQCAPHFSLSGPRTVTCDQRGQWSPELPKCRALNAYRRG